MSRLMDIGLERLRALILEMAQLSERSVDTAIEAYMRGRGKPDEALSVAQRLRHLQEEASEVAVELIARFQPVASDLRFIKSCMEIAYGFWRMSRYAYDIMVALDLCGDISSCDKADARAAAERVKEMIRLSAQAFAERDATMAKRLEAMDDEIDKIYLEHLKRALASRDADVRCILSGSLMLRYLERIADHAKYIGESVSYIAASPKD